MLIEFSVTNFRSISETVTLTMIPAPGKTKMYNLIPIEKNSNIKKLLKSCVIYGVMDREKQMLSEPLMKCGAWYCYQKVKIKGNLSENIIHFC